MCPTDGKGKHCAITYRKGLPPGHAGLLRELTVPVIRDDKVVAIAGVGNKPGAYTKADARNFQALADLTMDLVFRVRANSAG